VFLAGSSTLVTKWILLSKMFEVEYVEVKEEPVSFIFYFYVCIICTSKHFIIV